MPTIILFFLLFTLTQCRTYKIKCHYRSNSCRRIQSLWVTNLRQEHKGGPSLICGQRNILASTRDNTGQSTKDTPSHRINIKISDPTGSQILAAELERRYFVEHVNATACNHGGIYFKQEMQLTLSLCLQQLEALGSIDVSDY